MYRYSLAALALLGSVSAQTSTVSLALLDIGQANMQNIMGSVVSSDASATVYSLSCPDDNNNNDQNSMNNDNCMLPISFMVTQGLSTLHYGISISASNLESFSHYLPFSLSIPNLTGSVAGTVDYNCQLTGTTEADCTVTNIGTFEGNSASYSTKSKITGASELGYVPVTLTAQAAANPSASGSSAAAPSEGSGSSGGNAGAATQASFSTAGMPAITAAPQILLGGAAAALVYVAL